MNLSIIIPTYNSEDYILENIKLLYNFLEKKIIHFEIIIVNDGSTDRTFEIVENANIPSVKLLNLKKNQGKFAAIKHGIEHAKGDCCIFTDADLPYHLEAITYIENIINERKLHIVIADRSLSESNYKEQSTLFRWLFNIISRNFIRLCLIGGIFDSQAGLKGFRKDIAKELFPLIQENRFSGDIELLYIALKYNLEIKRIPVRIQRSAPSSVKTFSESFLALLRIIKLPINWRLGNYESKGLKKLSSQIYW